MPMAHARGCGYSRGAVGVDALFRASLLWNSCQDAAGFFCQLALGGAAAAAWRRSIAVSACADWPPCSLSLSAMLQMAVAVLRLLAVSWRSAAFSPAAFRGRSRRVISRPK